MDNFRTIRANDLPYIPLSGPAKKTVENMRTQSSDDFGGHVVMAAETRADGSEREDAMNSGMRIQLAYFSNIISIWLFFQNKIMKKQILPV